MWHDADTEEHSERNTDRRSMCNNKSPDFFSSKNLHLHTRRSTFAGSNGIVLDVDPRQIGAACAITNRLIKYEITSEYKTDNL